MGTEQGSPWSSLLLRTERRSGGWWFTHQYKNTTQFYFYAALLSSQNTKASKTGHTHDDRYYTETEINSKLNALNVNTDINFSLNGQSSCISHVSAYGKKTGKGTSIGYINYIFYIETDLNVWTRYKIFTLPYYATCAFGFAIDQDNGVCFLVEIESGSKDVYLTVQGTALKSGKWLRGQTVFVCW